MSDSNIFEGEGDLYYKDEALYAIQIFLFLYGDATIIKGAYRLYPLTDEGYAQCATFTLKK